LESDLPSASDKYTSLNYSGSVLPIMSATAFLRSRLFAGVVSFLLVGILFAARDCTGSRAEPSATRRHRRPCRGFPQASQSTAMAPACRPSTARPAGNRTGAGLICTRKTGSSRWTFSGGAPRGELAELFGKAAIAADREARIHGFRTLARKALALMPPAHRELVNAYTAGVNEGLFLVGRTPFRVRRAARPAAAWLPEDSLLVGYAMALDLQDFRGRYEQMLAAIQYSYGRTMLDFLVPEGPGWTRGARRRLLPQPPGARPRDHRPA